MSFSRRRFITSVVSLSAASFVPKFVPAAEAQGPLPIPPLLEAVRDPVTMEALSGTTDFLGVGRTPTLGFSQPYLGPTLRFRRGDIARVNVRNRLGFPITCHWHGLHVPAIVDGGPKLLIGPGKVWSPELPIDQAAATLWYHSHVHGKTADHVYAGLAGMIIIDDPDAADPGLPTRYGMDDIPLIIQDRAFGRDGSLYYVKRGPALMHGFRGNRVLVNGAVQPVASPPAGIVRLRLLNGSNARIYHLRFADGRTFHQVASDGGLLPKPLAMTSLSLAPAERAEILVDFSDGRPVHLLSGRDDNSPMGMGGMGGMGGMMGGMLPGSPPAALNGKPGEFEVLNFVPDRSSESSVKTIPTVFPGAPKPNFGEPQRVRRFSLDMHVGGRGRGMGMGMMGGGGGMMGLMGINGKAYDMDRVDVDMRHGETELWEVQATEMAHPFHVHGTSFQVVSNDGRDMAFERSGLKDVVLVKGKARILVKVDPPATPDIPFMYHCHILEHEDGGMMGQFTVT